MFRTVAHTIKHFRQVAVGIGGASISVFGFNIDSFIKVSSPYIKYLCLLGSLIITILTIAWLWIKIRHWEDM